MLCTVAGKGALHEGHPLAAGRLHHPLAREALLDEADALLLVGTQFGAIRRNSAQFFDASYASRPFSPTVLVAHRAGAAAAGAATARDARRSRCLLALGGVDRAGGRAVLAGAALAQPARSLAAHGGGGGRWGGGAAGDRGGKASADAPAALSVTCWDFEAQAAATQWCARSARCAPRCPTTRRSSPTSTGWVPRSLYRAGRGGFLYPVGTTALGYGLPAAVGAALGAG